MAGRGLYELCECRVAVRAGSLRNKSGAGRRRGGHAGVCEVARLVAAQPAAPDLAGHLAYLAKRTAHMQYPTFLAAGWPIGDGAVESGNKLVVEARLKGSGMHWARPHVDPMLALRNIVCSDRSGRSLAPDRTHVAPADAATSGSPATSTAHGA